MVVVIAYVGYTRTAGHFTYALDDAYIHMSLAKNLVTHGVMGATPFEFTSASSSPLWTLLLALVFKITGVHDVTPLILEVLVSIGLLVIADAALYRFGVRAIPRFLALFWIVFAAPLAPIVFGGMEHPLQILLDVAFVSATVGLMSSEDSSWNGRVVALLALAAGVGAIRYEGLVLVGVAALCIAARRRWSQAVALVAAGGLPAVLYGFWTMANGARFLPNPVLIKGLNSAGIGMLLQSPAAYAEEFARKWTTGYPLYLMVAACTLLLIVQWLNRRPLWSPAVLFPSVALLTSYVHLTVGDIGWFFRYEDYMVVLVGMSLIMQLVDLRPVLKMLRPASWAVLVVAVAFLAGGLLASANRGQVAFRSTAQAVKNIYDQQYQLAHFLKANPQYRSAAIGDLGAITYFNDDLRILDLEGLALNGVPVEEMGPERLSEARINQLVEDHGSQIAIVYPDYFTGQPASWKLVGSWTIENNLVTFGPEVTFLAIPPTDPDALARAMSEYSETQLPRDVRVVIEGQELSRW